MVGAGALAAITVIGAGLVDFPKTVAETGRKATARASAAERKRVKHSVRYVRLKPGQKAPAGAKVIREADPTPRVVVRSVVVSSPSRTVRSSGTRRTVVRTRQSGR